MRQAITVIISIVLLTTIHMQVIGQQDTLDYETRPFQLTFLFPPFSTNGVENVNIVNNLSLNPFIGVSGGVDGVELGGFINVDRFFMKGFQGAGFGNNVGGYVDGIQLSGFFNVAGGNVRYVQGAGFINATGGNQFGLQGAGFANVVGGDVFGFQGAGFCNVVGGTVTGVQGAGFINVSGNATTGLQGAGFMNVAGNFSEGIQAAGFGNIAGSGTVNLQASGFFNIADEVDGIQAAGFLNRAGYVKGIQAAGFLNICDSIDGVPIAFISIVKHNGYRKFELAASETQYAALSYKMGVKRLYTIYTIAKPTGPASRWLYGAGVGSQFPLSERSFLNVEVTSLHEIWVGDDRTPWFFYHGRFNSHNQLNASFGMKLGNIAEAFIGPTLNVAVASLRPDATIPAMSLAPSWAFFDRNYNNFSDTNVAIWMGLKGGIRF